MDSVCLSVYESFCSLAALGQVSYKFLDENSITRQNLIFVDSSESRELMLKISGRCTNN